MARNLIRTRVEKQVISLDLMMTRVNRNLIKTRRTLHPIRTRVARNLIKTRVEKQVINLDLMMTRVNLNLIKTRRTLDLIKTRVAQNLIKTRAARQAINQDLVPIKTKVVTRNRIKTRAARLAINLTKTRATLDLRKTSTAKKRVINLALIMMTRANLNLIRTRVAEAEYLDRMIKTRRKACRCPAVVPCPILVVND